MVKRAKLDGQARKLFFSETGTEEGKEKRAEKAAPQRSKAASAPVAGKGDLTGLVAKVEALKQMVAAFKGMADSEEFKKLTLKDLKK